MSKCTKYNKLPSWGSKSSGESMEQEDKGHVISSCGRNYKQSHYVICNVCKKW
jgi:hypothetical protein